MSAAIKYLRLYGQLARYTLARELAFRENFVVKVAVEALWLCILLAFYNVVFARTSVVAEWTRAEYLFFVGCYFALNGLLETLFLENCNEFGELVRKGDLDFLLIKPVDEQFLVSCRRVDWSTFPNVVMGVGVMLFALRDLDRSVGVIQVATFLAMFACGVLLSYAFMLVLTSISVWMVRNQSLMEMWWLFSSLARYPREIFSRVAWAEPIGLFFSFAVPILLVVYVPARVMVKPFENSWIVLFTILATVLALWLSRLFFFRALRSYRSASS